MAPALTITRDIEEISSKLDKTKWFSPDGISITIPEHQLAGAKYPDYLPVWDPRTVNQLSVGDPNYVDPGTRADPELPLLKAKGVVIKDLTPKFGSIVSGITLTELSPEEKDELAYLIESRGVVLFTDQESFKEQKPKEAVKFAEHFGPLHIHPTAGAPKGSPEVFIVHRYKEGHSYENGSFADRVSTITWHSDISFEKQTPGVTFLTMLEGPTVGGDTLYGDTVALYESLSPVIQEKLKALRVVHSGSHFEAVAKKNGGLVRHIPDVSVHPLVRYHPVLKKHYLYFNGGFVRGIEGLKKEESDFVIDFLKTLQIQSADFQARIKWEPNTVVAWDNRRTTHTALVDFVSDQRRHLFRLTTLAEKPFTDPEDA
ncbi:hypothetical protein BABINDRAFT_38115 [Babjeviella inositovora NRRL Y-12698]|uniref:TauD/TfdA-like domain-containing protein n=1 Tax=Babjeviella inositovora NRRL Y-12698 TaxID=984486 RepID=A0A1E3QMU2_9ASCO|nr:uncharacterized protein BABINDRAFT_38115 [Babjeviella inositovora NRRL Y-12698]ODQ78950.1 hypothetical protein BABINDRAFT_38115 [Babjeviella inositovora NRRL Y-12698]